MWWIYTTGLVFMLLAPAALVLAFKRDDRRPLLIGASLLLTGVIGLAGYFTYPVMHSVAQASAVGGYEQTLNSSLDDFGIETFECTRDGPCIHENTMCDPEEHKTYDTKGNVTGKTTTYHHCPIYTQEFSYYVTDAMGGRHDIASHVFAENPKVWRFGNIVLGAAQIPRGIPAKWQELVDRIKAGDYPPITIRDEYENFILGSGSNDETSDDIDLLKEKGLLPPHTANMDDPIYDQFKADKMQFVAMNASGNQAIWQDYLMRFNAMLGMEDTHGDLHLVAIRASALPSGVSPDDYIAALKVCWLECYGKKAFPKNAIALALGISDDGMNVKWARAATGMPRGNGEMLRALQFRLSNNTPSLAFDPDRILGKTTARKTQGDDGKPQLAYTSGEGIVPEIIMVDFRFKRACMKCDDEDEKDQAGYVNLKELIPISTGGTIGGVVIVLFLSVGLTSGFIWGYASITLATVRYTDYGYSSSTFGRYPRLFRTP